MNNENINAKTHNIYKIDIKKYEIIKAIKEEDFECVFSIREKDTHNGYSARTIFYSRENDDYKQIIIREINIMLEIHHPTLINFIGFSLKDFEGKKNVTILMDHFKNISLSYIIKKIRTRPDEIDYDNTDRQITLIGIARGMMFLHQNHIIHRDLNPSNIFLDEECEPHIIGHGISKIHLNGQNKKTINQCVPSIYTAPETIKDNIYNTKTDVYSFGIIMYELITNQIPFPELQKSEVTDQQIKTSIIEKGLQPTFSADVKKPFKKLIERCWSKNPAERPTFEEIYYKLSFNEFDVDTFDAENENETEYKIKYFLDDVYKKRVFKYVDKIKGKSNFDELISQNNQMKKEIENMKNEIEQLKKNQKNEVNNDDNKKNDDDEIENMKKEIEQLKTFQMRHNSQDNETSNIKNDKIIENMKKEIEQLKKNQTEQIQKNEANNNNTKSDEEIEKMKKEIEQLKTLLIKQKSQDNENDNNNKNDEDIESMKKEIKKIKKILMKQKSQENENKNDNENDTDEEIQKLKKELSESQKINNVLIQHIKKLKSSFKEMVNKYDQLTSEHTNHIQILAKEIIALKTSGKKLKHSSEEKNEQSSSSENDEENKNEQQNKETTTNDFEGGLIEPFGIENLDNSSYINSSLQCFLSLPLFIEKIDSLISNSNSNPILLSNFKNFIETKGGDLMKIKQIILQKNDSLNQDSFEFSISFINTLYEENKKIISDLFMGKLQMITKCGKCMDEITSEQEFSSISFSLKKSRPILYIPFSFKENPILLVEKPQPNSQIQILNSKTPFALIGQFVLMAKTGNKFKVIDDFSPEFSEIYAFELNNSNKKGGPLSVIQIKDEDGIPLIKPFICEIPNLTFVNENELKTIVINRLKEILPGLTRSKQEELKKFIKFTKPNKFPHRFKTMIKTPMFCSGYVNVKVLKKDVFNFTFKSVKIQKKEISLSNLFNGFIQQSRVDYQSKIECDKCHKKSRVLKRIKLTKLPKILVFQVKKIDLSDVSFIEDEISIPHSFSIDLDDSFNKIIIDPDQNEKSAKYELRAISHNSRSSDSENFWADGKRADKWYELNGSTVNEISEPNEKSKSSYIAFYQCLS